MLAPQCPAYTTWATQLDALDALLSEATSALPVDEDQVLVTGMSMGGGGAWLLASAFPERFAALAPVCASKWYAGNVDEQVSHLTHLPVWAFHGEEDDIVPFAETVKLVEALKRQGGNVRFTRYPGVGHNSWDQAYAEPDLYPWLLQQKGAKSSARE
jgi:predicted peptidase